MSRENRGLTFARVYLYCTFNNTIITLTDADGNAVAYSSGGCCNFSGKKKATMHAAQSAAARIFNSSQFRSVKTIELYVSGPGAQREAAMKYFLNCGLVIKSIQDVSGVPHNGVKSPKIRKI